MEKLEYKEIDGQKWFKFNSKLEEQRYKHFYLFNFLIIFLALFLIGFIFLYAIPEFNKNIELITSNPLVYGVKQIKPDNAQISCSCTIMEIGKLYESLNFNDKEIYWGDKEINFSNINFSNNAG